LINVNQVTDVPLQPGCEDLGDDLNWAVLERNRPEILWSSWSWTFREKDDVSPVDSIEVYTIVVEALEEGHDGVPDRVLGCTIPCRAKAVRAGHAVDVHAFDCKDGFGFCEWGDDIFELPRWLVLIEIMQLKIPGR
jgi:hypothetical protein